MSRLTAAATVRRQSRYGQHSVEGLAHHWWGKRAGPVVLSHVLQSHKQRNTTTCCDGDTETQYRRKFVRIGLALTSSKTSNTSSWPSSAHPKQRNLPVHKCIEGLPLPGDGFLLNLLRASASHVITTGKNVRLETALVPGLFGPHAPILQRWRRRFVTAAPLSVWVLSHGKDPRALLTSAYFKQTNIQHQSNHTDATSKHATERDSCRVRISVVAPRHALAGLRRVADELGLVNIGFIGYCANNGGLVSVINDALHGRGGGSSSGNSGNGGTEETRSYSNQLGLNVDNIDARGCGCGCGCGGCGGDNSDIGGGLVVMEAGPNTANQFATSCEETSQSPCYDLVALTSYVPHNQPPTPAPARISTRADAAEAWPVDWQSNMRVAAQSTEWHHSHGKWTFQLWTRKEDVNN